MEQNAERASCMMTQDRATPPPSPKIGLIKPTIRLFIFKMIRSVVMFFAFTWWLLSIRTPHLLPQRRRLQWVKGILPLAGGLLPPVSPRQPSQGQEIMERHRPTTSGNPQKQERDSQSKPLWCGVILSRVSGSQNCFLLAEPMSSS